MPKKSTPSTRKYWREQKREYRHRKGINKKRNKKRQITRKKAGK